MAMATIFQKRTLISCFVNWQTQIWTSFKLVSFPFCDLGRLENLKKKLKNQLVTPHVISPAPLAIILQTTTWKNSIWVFVSQKKAFPGSILITEAQNSQIGLLWPNSQIYNFRWSALSLSLHFFQFLEEIIHYF